MVKTKIKDPELIIRRQQQICRGAMQVFRTKGYHAASIREIARAAGISLGSLYDYIEKKEDILFLVHKNILAKIYQTIDQSVARHEDPAMRLLSAIKDLFYLALEIHEEILFIYTETKSLDKTYLKEVLESETRFVGAFEKLINDGVEKGVFVCEHPRIMANLVAYIMAVAPLRGWNILDRNSPEELLGEIMRLVKNSLEIKEENLDINE